MKKLVILVLVSCLTLTASANEKVDIAAGKAVELTYEEFTNYDLRLSNRSGKQVNVSVLDPVTRKQVKGFGLGPMGTVKLTVAEGQILKLKNTSAKDISISIDFIEKMDRVPTEESDTYVNFTLHNSSLKSIPLIIPNVMNPNLSPMSNSGVSLKMGQKIYYKKGVSRKILLEVNEEIQSGDKVDVARLITKLEKGS